MLDRKEPALRAKADAACRYGARIEGNPVEMWKSRLGRVLAFQHRGGDFPTCPQGATTIGDKSERQQEVPLKCAKSHFPQLPGGELAQT